MARKNNEFLLKKNFPHVIPLNRSFTEFDGFITVLGHDFRVHIIMNSDKSITVFGNWKLLELLQKEEPVFRKKSSILTFLHQLEAILEQQLKKRNSVKFPALSIFYYGTILNQIQNVGWEKVSFLSEDLREVHLLAVDVGGRSHTLQLEFSFGFSDKEVKCSTGLPVNFEVKWKKATTLCDVYREFEQQIYKFQLFWNCMDQLDQKCWVLEPENPGTKDCRRRLALSSNTSIHIQVDPFAPTSLPVYDFMGPDQAVFSHMETFQKNIELWDEKKTILDNLSTVLEICFLSPETTSKEDLKQECGICYAYVLEEALPNCLCDNTHCGQPFHQCCLYEWLRAIPSTRQSFDVLFGECPYCSKSISCKMV